MLLETVARASAGIAAISARGAKVTRLAELLGALAPTETAAVVTWLSGELTQRQIGVGWASLRELPPAAELPSLQVAEVEHLFTEIGTTSGPGSQSRRRDLLYKLFAAATDGEQVFLRRLL